ncbi:DUF7519 family protein [Halobiforma nitratireducens]|uniref:Uncharacterized protein n=1 Tax=Halobiforma nitratireducens JCM 10879 TaxID=1227454 RepID=M0M7N3_9EURY|nr:hypothetical protein [Halobiforma nitratireducens]EMA41731.1 hypothetical protein C446_05430 [Halobiforma nitratireducens JCM 10879]
MSERVETRSADATEPAADETGGREPADLEPDSDTPASNSEPGSDSQTGTDPASDTDAAVERDGTDLEAGAGVELTRKPAIASSLVAVAAAVVAVVLSGLFTATAVTVGAAGVVLLSVALAVGHRSAADAGAVLVFGGVLLAGFEGGIAAVEPTLIATVTTVLAWDRAHAAIDIGEQLGRESETLRLEAVGLASSLVVGLIAATVGYTIYVVAGGGQPVSALVLLLLAAFLITVGLGREKQSGGRWGSRRR